MWIMEGGEVGKYTLMIRQGRGNDIESESLARLE